MPSLAGRANADPNHKTARRHPTKSEFPYGLLKGLSPGQARAAMGAAGKSELRNKQWGPGPETGRESDLVRPRARPGAGSTKHTSKWDKIVFCARQFVGYGLAVNLGAGFYLE